MPRPAVVVIVGAGPNGAGLLERISANLDAAEELRTGPLEIHLVDPFPPGPGRVWRHAQSPLLRMNSMAEDVTMFTDESVRCQGPVRPGPSLAEWATAVRAGEITGVELDAELMSLRGNDFPTRQVQSKYLEWFFRHTIRRLPDSVTVHVHATTATAVTGNCDQAQQVWLADRVAPLAADAVVLALGHLDAEPEPEQRRLADFATEHGLAYLPPEYSADADLSAIPAGEPVVMRGFGQAFIDLMVLLTEGRGGRFEPVGDGLRYLPSGQEPVLYVGSRRGVPYHAKTTYRLQGESPELPKFFDANTIDGLLAQPGRLEFRRDVWPAMAKEIGWGYYRELFTGHPDKVAMDWAEFAEHFAELEFLGQRMRDLVARAVPAKADRLDLATLDRPLRGMSFDRFADLGGYLHDYVEQDLARRSDPAFSADLGAFLALLSVYGQLPRLLESGRLSARSQVEEFDGWWAGFFSFYASGPPGDRLEQLLALSRAGVLRFLGPDMWVRADAERGRFVAGSAGVTEELTASGLIEARLPRANARRSGAELLRRLVQDGDGAEEVLAEGAFGHNTGLLLVRGDDARVLDRDGRAHQRRFALGAHTNGRSVAAFARPRTNAPSFRRNDNVARELLRFLASAERPEDLVPVPRTAESEHVFGDLAGRSRC
ncbi:FAD/NAD(P)-binding protein [Crossiella cryophila]|uniref:Putative NAD(P)/FAD-binding protein YdhS n=1 Tax=Crossiella cryophila TaxID=43355 RepID=A0A7W7CHY1_9PSEU|nr:FAD/NAD(P)-binding protein [Crossiella cryophila]MBB4681565.1 putative NAD(P)/FAD-binding protein YdhS [Crossiella cryophila]